MISPETSLQAGSRKRQLVEACAADRAAWAAACRADPPAKVGFVHKMLGRLDLIGHLLPVAPGRWVRGALFVAGLAKKFSWMRR